MDAAIPAKPTRLRFPEYDIAKGIGVLLVVIGHIGRLPFPVLVWIFSFHIPMYFFISGMFVKPDNQSSLWLQTRRNIRGLLLPYLVFSLIFILCDTIIRDPITNPKLELKLTLMGQGGFAILWFFYVLFFERLLLDILKRLIHRKWLLSIVVLALVAAGFLLRRFGFNSFKIATILYASGFYYLGFLLQDSPWIKKWTARDRWYLLPVYLLLNILGCVLLVRFSGTTLDLNTATSFDILLNYLTAMMGIGFTLVLSRLLVGKAIGKALAYIGKNSLYFYPLMGYIPFKFEYVTQTDLLILKLLSYIAAFLISVLVTEVSRRIKERMAK